MIDTRQLLALDSVTNNRNKTISRQEYETFCKEFIFNKLQNISFGDAFCEKFGFNNFMLSGLTDKTAKHLIENLGYVK